jgi:acid phosphatase type 7
MKSIFLIIALCFMLNSSAQSVAKATPNTASRSNKTSTEQMLLRGPYLQCATSNSMIIRWRTSQSVIGKVKYGKTLTQLNKQVAEPKSATEHIVKIEGLAPETKYYYTISGDGKQLQGDKDNCFTTLPITGKEGVYRVGIFGDPGSLTTLQLDVRNQFLKYLGNYRMNVWVALGDIAYDHGWDAEYQVKFFNIYKDKLLKSYPLFTVPGNHDYGDQDSETYFNHNKIDYYKTFSMPVSGESGGVPSHDQAYYSFDVGNIHFLMLDSFGEEDSTTLADTTGPQVQWIKKDLEANKNKGWVIALWHHPPYSMGSHNSDEQSDMYKIRQNFLPLLERYNIDLVICGHSHLYERSKLISGHFGKQGTFNSDNVVSNSSGLYDGSANSCPYIKNEHNRGAVYLVNGGSSEVGGVQKTFPHTAMYYSNNIYGGTNMLEVQGNRLDMKWITEDGVIRDHFTMMKNVNKKSVVHLKKGESTTLTASFVGDYEWNNKQNLRSIKVAPAATTTYTVHDKQGCIQDTFDVVVSE